MKESKGVGGHGESDDQQSGSWRCRGRRPKVDFLTLHSGLMSLSPVSGPQLPWPSMHTLLNFHLLAHTTHAIVETHKLALTI